MSISAQGTEHFRIYLFNTKSLGHDNWSANIYGQYCAIMTIFLKMLSLMWRTGCKKCRICRLSLHITENQLIVALWQKHFSSRGNI